MGNRVRINNLIIEWVHPLLQNLAQEVNETVNLAQILDDTALYLDRAESRRSLQLKAVVGDRLPLYRTGLGKAILSILEPERLEPLIENLKLEKKTAHTITDPADFRKQLESIHGRGYAIDQEEFDEGLVCVAVPLKMAEIGFYGSISVSGPINRFDQARAEFLGGKLLASRDRILPVLGFTRISEQKIRDRSEVYSCDRDVVLDETLIGADTAAGLKEDGIVLINTASSEKAGSGPSWPARAASSTSPRARKRWFSWAPSRPAAWRWKSPTAGCGSSRKAG